ncbi:MAG: ABC transporter permease [Methanotrichaceae archaeon]
MNEISAGLLRAIELIITLNPEIMSITARSLSISIASIIFGSLICIPLGGLIEFHDFHGKRWLMNIIQTLYSLPTVIVGLLVFLLLTRDGPLGSLNILFTPSGMVLGQTILITPIMIGLTITALRGVDVQIKETAKSLGATPPQIIFTVINEAKHSVVAAVLLGFGRAISEVGVAMMIGGNIRGYTRVLTTSIALETSMGDIELSLALGMILLLLSLVINIVINRIQGR